MAGLVALEKMVMLVLLMVVGACCIMLLGPDLSSLVNALV